MANMDNTSNQERYKILINGRNTAFVTDFIQYTEVYFKCLSTTDCFLDIVNHFEFLQPDAYVLFADSVDSKILNQTNPLKDHRFYNGAPVIVICDEATSKEIELTARYTVDLIIKRPISADNLALRIIRFFEERKEKEEEQRLLEEAKRLEKEEKAKERAKKEEELEKARETVAKAAEAANAEKKHILVVDDDRTILKMIKAALEENYDVTTMVNGVMVEKFLETKKVDLVILDYEMPVETGADVFRKIKKNEKARRVPVCFLTGVSEREKIMEVMSLKPHGYLLKPIDMDMFFATVRNLTEE